MSEFTLLNDAQLRVVLELAQERLFPFTTGFVRIDRGPEPQLAGSGTLVVVDGVHGILTADHVLTNVPATGPLGLVFGSHTTRAPHRFTFDADHARPLRIAPASGDESGPDLGFMILPQKAVSAIKARASFYEITRRRDRMLASPPPIDNGGWILTGMVEEWSELGEGELGFARTKHFTTVCGGSAVSREEVRGHYDYLYFRVKSGDVAQNRPFSFEGASGGALWQLVVRVDRETLSIKEPLLSGVAFYQTPIENGERTIVCHGRRSIYHSTVDGVRRAVANPLTPPGA